MNEKHPSMIAFAHEVTLEQLNKLNPNSSHLLRLVGNIDLLIKDAKILEIHDGTNERILFLYLTAFEQLQVLIARFDDLERLPHNHKEKLAPLENYLTEIKKILDMKDGKITDLRNACLYEDENFETKHTLSKIITHLTVFTPHLSAVCAELLLVLEKRWNNSLKTYLDLGCDKGAYESRYQDSKKK